jgi:hypothetical protein
MATRLKKLRIDEVSLCDRGANPHARITLFKRDVPAIETPKDSAPLEFNATGRGPAHDRLFESFDNHRRQMGPAQGRTAFQTAWAELTDDEKQEIRNEEAATEAAKLAAAAAAEKERQREMMKQMNNPKLQEIVKLAHQIQDGKIGNHADRASWYGAIKALAEEHREPGETAQRAFARVITKTVDGRAMFAAYQGSAGSDYVPPTPEPARVIKADSAYARLKKIASNLREERPELKLTEAAAFLKVFTDPVNRELADLSKREQVFA